MQRLIDPAAELVGRLQTLGDETRARLLLLLEEHEMTVSELCAVLQLPQSTVSRHLKVLSDDGWLRSRSVGTSRHYRLAELDEAATALWTVIRETVQESTAVGEDAERARAVLAQRRAKSRAFFSTAASDWGRLREELFGRHSAFVPLLGLLDPTWVVADLGAGTGALSHVVAPFVRQVISVDASAEMLEALRDRVSAHGNVRVRRGELESVPIEDGAADVAFMVFVLHYVVEPWSALAEAHRVLRPGGRLIIVDMREHEREEYRAEMGHVWLGVSEVQLEAWSARAGFADVSYGPVPADPEAKGPLLFAATLRKA